MTLKVSPAVPAKVIQLGDNQVFSSHSADLAAIAPWASPVITLDHYRLTGQPFMPHAHGGFTAIAYVLEDSQTPLRTRDALGGDFVTDPGGLLLTEAGSGVVHEDTTLDLSREMHGIQLFINHSQPNKFRQPRVQQVLSGAIPEWTGPDGDRVRVVIGEYGGLTSPAEMVEPCRMLDARISSRIAVPVKAGDTLIVSVLEGIVDLIAGAEQVRIEADQAAGVNGGDGEVVLVAAGGPAAAMIVSGTQIDQPLLRHANAFFMHSQDEIDDAVARHQRGEMGTLVPRTQMA